MTIPIILSTGSLYNLDVDTTMALAAEAGFAGLELGVDWRWETHRLAHLERLMARHRLPILAVHSPFRAVPIQSWPADPVERIKQSVALAEALGAQTVVVHPPERWLRLQLLLAGPERTRKLTLPLPLAGLGRLGRWLLAELPEFQTQTPVKIAVENMPCRPFGPFTLEPHHWSRPDQLRRFPYLALDTTHVGTRRVDLLDFYAQLRPQVTHLHLSNYRHGREHQLLAQGDLPLTALLTRLATDGFTGLISLELNAFDLQAEDMRALRQNLRDSLEFCKEGLGQAHDPAS